MTSTINPRHALMGVAIVAILFRFDLAGAANTAPPEHDGSNRAATHIAVEPEGELTLERALVLALEHNAELASAAKGYGASEAAISQAGVLPNPVLSAASENLGNTRLREGGDHARVIALSQLIELGGKRDARVKLAQAGRDLAAWDYQTMRADLILAASVAFVDVLAAQQGQALAEESVTLARAFADTVSRRVAAGKTSPVEETKARVSLLSAGVEFDQAKRELAAARQRLSSLWNNPAPRFASAAGDLERMTDLPNHEQLLQRARGNPDLARWEAEIAQRNAATDAAKARSIPDLTVTGGLSQFSRFNDTAFTIGIAIPIPLFDRNRGGTLEALRLRDKTLEQKRAAENKVETLLANAGQRLAAVRTGIETLKADILPGAQSALDATRKGYELGKFGFIDVLDAQRTLSQVRTQYLEALTRYHRGVREMERLIGDELGPAPPAAAPIPAGDKK